MQAFFPARGLQLPGFAQIKTYAAYPVWKNSSREEIKFAPLPKRQAVKIFHDARRFERQTAITRVDAFGKRSTQGKLGRMGILVLHSMLFDFLNYNSGRLDPSRQAIAASACISMRSVSRALVRLRDAGVLNWVRRCRGSFSDGRYLLEQDSNAYGVTPSSQWRGFWRPPEPPGPHPSAWGATPPGAPLAVQAIEAHRAGDKRQAAALLAADPGDWIAAAAARLKPAG
jgi:hypothetical protein